VLNGPGDQIEKRQWEKVGKNQTTFKKNVSLLQTWGGWGWANHSPPYLLFGRGKGGKREITTEGLDIQLGGHVESKQPCTRWGMKKSPTRKRESDQGGELLRVNPGIK